MHPVILGLNLRHCKYVSIFVEALQSELGDLRHCGGGKFGPPHISALGRLGDLLILGGLV